MGKFEQPRGQKKPEPKRPEPKRLEPDDEYYEEEEIEGAGRGLKTGIIIGICVVVALIAGAVAYALSVAKSDTIFPNVYVAGVNVGGMTREEAEAAVRQEAGSSYSTSTLIVKLPDRALSFGPEQTNVTLDVEGAIEKAWSFGRDKGIFEALMHRLRPGDDQYINIEQSLTLDKEGIRAIIDQVAQEVRSARVDSTCDIVTQDVTGADGSLTAVPTELVIHVGSCQRSLDGDALYDAVVAALMENDFTPLTFTYDESAYTQVDLDKLYDELCTDMKDAYYDNDRKEIVEESAGYGFDLAAARQRQAMAEEGSTLTITLTTIEPSVTSAVLQEKLFHDVLASYDSPVTNNYSRTNNLDLACKAIDGTVLNAGDIFSFNDVVGERTAAKGYQGAIVYVQGDSVPELGGGVCQVASTIYTCCILADLNVVERKEHMFSVTYVPLGADATIYWGSLDFKFENSTPYPIRIDASVSGGFCHISLIGTKETDETIEIESVTTATIPWSDVEKVDEEKPEGYRNTVQSPYTGYEVTLYIQRYNANHNPIGSREPAQYPYSRYNKRDRLTIVGGGKKDDEEDPTGTDPGTEEPPADTPPTDEPPADTPPTDEPPADTPPADTPPADTPPADTPPTPELPPVDITQPDPGEPLNPFE